MFKKKPIDYNQGRVLLENLKTVNDLLERVDKLETKVAQLECKHDFKFYSCERWDEAYSVYHKCPKCKKTTRKNWDDIAKTGQQAMKLLNLVPKDWKVKGAKDE